MGKADKLMQGAKKTATGLFAGMTPLDAREVAVPEKKNTVNIPDEKEDAVKAEVIKTPVIEEPEVVNAVEEKKEEVEQVITEPKPIEVVKEKKTIDIIKAIEKPQAEKEETEETVNPEKAPASDAKSGSRYEKEKFLLLDIRGYRDYVEHMAKAANMSATKYIRSLIQTDMDKNMDIYEAQKALEEMLKGRAGN